MAEFEKRFARVAGGTWREATGLGILMNTRGLMGLVILNIGLDIGVIITRFVLDDGRDGTRDHLYDNSAARMGLSDAHDPGRVK